MLRAVIYLRVSTEAQANEGTSLVTQEATCLKKASEIGAVVVGTHSDDGVSGAKYLTRSGIIKTIEQVERGEADLVIIANFTRYSRDVEQQHTIKNRIVRAGGRLLFCDIPTDNTPAGNLAFGIFGTFAQYEREMIRERTMSGRRQKAEDGQQPARSRSPFGYHVPTKDEVLQGHYPLEELGKYTIVPEQATVVTTIFSLIVSGLTLGQVATSLQDNGTPTPRGSCVWHRETVRCILNNPAYKGEAAFGRTRAIPDERYKQGIKKPTSKETWTTILCPAIVSEGIWDAAQQRLRRNKEGKRGRPSNTMILSGLLTCPSCGGKMYGSISTTPTKTYRFYRCHRNKPDAGRRCTQPGIRAEEADRIVRQNIARLATDSKVKQAFLHYEKEQDKAESPMVSWQQEWDKLERKNNATARSQTIAIENGGNAEAFGPIWKEIKATRERLLSSRPQEQRSRVKTDHIAQFASDLVEMMSLKDFPAQDANRILKRSLSRLTIAGDTVHVTMYSPLLSDNDKEVPILLTISHNVIEIEKVG